MYITSLIGPFIHVCHTLKCHLQAFEGAKDFFWFHLEAFDHTIPFSYCQIHQFLIARPSIYFVSNFSSLILSWNMLYTFFFEFLWSISIIIKTFFLSCANMIVIPQCCRCWCLFVLKIQVFLASPSPPRGLYMSVETMISILLARPSPSTHKKLDIMIKRVLDFIKLEIEACLTSVTRFYNDG